MTTIDIDKVLRAKLPKLFETLPVFLSKLIVRFFERLLCVKEINEFINEHSNKYGFDFIDALFNYLNFNYELSESSMGKIPAEGRLVVVSNHPLGGLDGLAIVRAMSEVRSDVKIVANDVLSYIDNLNSVFLPLDMYSACSQKENITRINQAIANDEAVIFFPSGEVSRMSWTGIKDRKWKKGAIRFAIKNNAPILPAFIQGRNSIMFYSLSILWRRIGLFLLPRELFAQRNKKISIKFGDTIPPSKFDFSANSRIQMNLLMKHIYRLGEGKKVIFATEKTIMQAVPTKLLLPELEKSELLGVTNDGKNIYICKYSDSPNIMKEIARLREITFRLVGEGTGKALDTDEYDKYYNQMVLWDEEDKEIVGAYRLGITQDLIKSHGKAKLYNSSLFNFNDSFDEVLTQSIELGRSFIQQKYWRTNALDYIWQGIGAYVQKHKNIRYLWGSVCMSNSYSELAKSMVVYYYQMWYSSKIDYALPNIPYNIPAKRKAELDELFVGNSLEEDFRILKINLKQLGFSIPVLYRRYTELCNIGGSTFITFSIDQGLMNAVDGLVLVDLHQLRDEYKERYYNQKSFKE